jgi:hypothetical protein
MWLWQQRRSITGGKACNATTHESRLVPQQCLQRLHRGYELPTARPDLIGLAATHDGVPDSLPVPSVPVQLQSKKAFHR